MCLFLDIFICRQGTNPPPHHAFIVAIRMLNTRQPLAGCLFDRAERARQLTPFGTMRIRAAKPKNADATINGQHRQFIRPGGSFLEGRSTL
jgi:hypothetical protein